MADAKQRHKTIIDEILEAEESLTVLHRDTLQQCLETQRREQAALAALDQEGGSHIEDYIREVEPLVEASMQRLATFLARIKEMRGLLAEEDRLNDLTSRGVQV